MPDSSAQQDWSHQQLDHHRRVDFRLYLCPKAFFLRPVSPYALAIFAKPRRSCVFGRPDEHHISAVSPPFSAASFQQLLAGVFANLCNRNQNPYLPVFC